MQAEEEQIRLLEQIAQAESDVSQRSVDLSSYRQESSISDQKNLNLRKEIEQVEALVNEQKDSQHHNCNTLLHIRDVQMNTDKDLDVQQKKI